MGKIKDIGQEIIILRAGAGWTQQQLAEKMETTQRTVAAWESGESVPRNTMKVKLAQVFGRPSDYFLDESDDSVDEARDLIDKISDVMYGTANNISDEKKRMCIDAIEEIMDIKK